MSGGLTDGQHGHGDLRHVKASRLSIVSIVSIASRDGAKSAAAVGSQGVGSESAVLGQNLGAGWRRAGSAVARAVTSGVAMGEPNSSRG